MGCLQYEYKELYLAFEFFNLSSLSQGITVKIDEDGDLVIARILSGSLSDRLRELCF